MSNKNEVFEYLIDQLRQQVNNNQCEDLAHEVQSLKNQLRDASEQIKELTLALDSSDNEVICLRSIVDIDPKVAIGYIKRANSATTDTMRREYLGKALEELWCNNTPEQSGCRKEDTQYNAWRPHYGTRQPVPDGTMVFIRYRNGEQPKISVDAKNRLWIWDGTYSDIVEYKIDTQECKHEWRFYGAGFSCKCIKCGAIS